MQSIVNYIQDITCYFTKSLGSLSKGCHNSFSLAFTRLSAVTEFVQFLGAYNPISFLKTAYF